MGQIKRNGDSVIVEMTLSELFQQENIIKVEIPFGLENGEQSTAYLSTNYHLDDSIAAVAWKLLNEKAPQFVRKFRNSRVKGSCSVMVVFDGTVDEDSELMALGI